VLRQRRSRQRRSRQRRSRRRHRGLTQRREVNRLAPGRSIEGDVDGVVRLQVLQVIHVDAIC
jgi:hypothetical protein